MWTGENDMNTVACGRGSFCNRENIYAVLNLHGYVWTGPDSDIEEATENINIVDLDDDKDFDIDLRWDIISTISGISIGLKNYACIVLAKYAS